MGSPGNLAEPARTHSNSGMASAGLILSRVGKVSEVYLRSVGTLRHSRWRRQNNAEVARNNRSDGRLNDKPKKPILCHRLGLLKLGGMRVRLRLSH